MSPSGHEEPKTMPPRWVRCSFESSRKRDKTPLTLPCQDRTPAPQQTSGRAFPAVIFGYLSVECPFHKFDGINCRPKLGAKLLNRFFHRRRQVSPPVNNVTHRFFDGSQHSQFHGRFSP